MPPRRLSGVRDNIFAAFEHPARPFTTLNQTIVTPPYWSITANPPHPDILRRHGDDAVGYEVAAGWPFVALHGAIVGQPPAEPTRIWAIELPLRSAYAEPGTTITTGRILPLRPILPGFVLNLLFWTGVCALARAAMNRVRSARNLARGRCPNPPCGYPLAGLDQCPECGKAVAAPAAPRPG